MFLDICFTAEITSKIWANEIRWSLSSADDPPVCQNTQIYENDKTTSESCCLLPGEYTLTCKDTYGDGWHGGFIEIQGTTYCDDCLGGCAEKNVQVILGHNITPSSGGILNYAYYK